MAKNRKYRLLPKYWDGSTKLIQKDSSAHARDSETLEFCDDKVINTDADLSYLVGTVLEKIDTSTIEKFKNIKNAIDSKRSVDTKKPVVEEPTIEEFIVEEPVSKKQINKGRRRKKH